MATETEQGLAILYESDSNIESLITRYSESTSFSVGDNWCQHFCSFSHSKWLHSKTWSNASLLCREKQQSYRDHADFANDAVMKLLSIGVVAEVSRNELRCINPLTVAQNSVKLRLCIDLSRCFNLQCDAQTFKIESTVQALASIDLTISCSVSISNLLTCKSP